MMAESAFRDQYSQPQVHRKPLPHLQPTSQYQAVPNAYSHSRSRTTSSSVFPNSNNYPHSQTTMLAAQPQYQARRNPSVGTFTTTSSGNGARQSIASSSDLRRSTSSRSGNSQPTSYVALMRKQKATVWCDRAQHEDPRLVAAQRMAKQRAAMEVLGGSKGSTGNRTGTAGSGSIVGSNRVTAKIRHHGKAGLVGYNPSENFGVGVGGVPMRLSASEVEGGDSDDEEKTAGPGGMYHHRSGSGRSSLGSGRRGLTYRTSGQSGRWSSGNTPPDSLSDLPESAETPVPAGHPNRNSNKDYFSASGSGANDAQSAGSGSSGERRDEVAGLDERESAAARLASRSLLANTNLVAREKSVRDPEGLARRGSVDERTATMKLGAGRLFVANPDADDSD